MQWPSDFPERLQRAITVTKSPETRKLEAQLEDERRNRAQYDVDLATVDTEEAEALEREEEKYDPEPFRARRAQVREQIRVGGLRIKSIEKRLTEARFQAFAVARESDCKRVYEIREQRRSAAAEIEQLLAEVGQRIGAQRRLLEEETALVGSVREASAHGLCRLHDPPEHDVLAAGLVRILRERGAEILTLRFALNGLGNRITHNWHSDRMPYGPTEET